MACILNFVKQIQLKFLYDKVKGVFLIGTKFQSDMIRFCFVVAKATHEILQRTYKESAIVSTCISHWCRVTHICVDKLTIIIPPPNEVGGGVYWIHLVRPSVRPSVCRRHGFRSISQVCFGISISNFICMLMLAIGRSLLIFRDVTFKMAAWQPYWIFWFPDSNFTLALNINLKLQRHNTYVYG